MRWRKCQGSGDTHVTGAEGYLSMTKKVKSQSGLKAINDIVIIEEDAIAPEVDNASGLTKNVVDSIKGGKLFIPETAQYALEKYPCKGLVLSKGNLCKHVNEGDRVLFARLGGQRMLENGKSFVSIRERDIHAIIN